MLLNICLRCVVRTKVCVAYGYALYRRGFRVCVLLRVCEWCHANVNANFLLAAYPMWCADFDYCLLCWGEVNDIFFFSSKST